VPDIGAVNMTDQMLIVDQKTDQTTAFGTGTAVTGAMTSVLAGLPVTVDIETSFSFLSEPISWPADTSRAKIINDLAALVAYHELYFDNLGLGQLHPMPNPEETDLSVVRSYPIGRRTLMDSLTRSTDQILLPNRFVVVSSGTTEAAFVGVYDIPDEAPHSIANRGYPVAHVENLQGIGSQAEARNAAQALARGWRFAYETIEFSSPPDPRHDTYDTLDFEGVRFLEQSWSMPLREGAPMRHTARRTYEHTPVEALTL
jgi:hypothetical protein